MFKEKIEQEYRDKIEANRRLAEEKTAKRRAKRLKKKKNLQRKLKRRKRGTEQAADVKDEDESGSEGENDDDGSKNVQVTGGNSREENSGEDLKRDAVETESEIVARDEASEAVNARENESVALTE